MDGSMVWKINCATKHGVDTILVRGDSEPTKNQLNKLYTKLRKEFGISIDKNSVHGSDSKENAEKEISFFFKE